MVTSPQGQMDMFPELLPLFVRRVWAAKLKHDASDRTGAVFTLEIGERLLKRDGHGKPYSKSAIWRACRSDKTKHWLPWVLLRMRGSRPPWETHPELLDDTPLATSSDDSPEVLPLDHWLATHPDGRLVVDKNNIVRVAHRLTALAASVAGVTMLLDVLSDGKYNHVIAWCRLLLLRGHLLT